MPTCDFGSTYRNSLTSLLVIRKYPRDFPPIDREWLCAAYASEVFSAIGSFSTVLGRLHEYPLILFSCSSATSHPNRISNATRVLAAHTPSPLFSKGFMSKWHLEQYRALPASCSFFSCLSSPALMMEFHGIRSAPFFSASSLLPERYVSRRKCSKKLSGGFSGSMVTGTHPLECA